MERSRCAGRRSTPAAPGMSSLIRVSCTTKTASSSCAAASPRRAGSRTTAAAWSPRPSTSSGEPARARLQALTRLPGPPALPAPPSPDAPPGTGTDTFCNPLLADGAGPASGFGEMVSTTAKVGKGLGGVGATLGLVGLGCEAGQADFEEKPFSSSACLGLSSVSAGTGIAGLLGRWNPVGWSLGAVSLGTGLLSTAVCAIDPDARFRQIAKPKPIAAGLPRAPKGTSPKVQAAARAMLNNARRIVGHGRAMHACVNRASGAALASEPVWEKRQHACAASNAARMASLYRKQLQFNRLLGRAVRSAGIASRNIKAPSPRGVSQPARTRRAEVGERRRESGRHRAARNAAGHKSRHAERSSHP